MKASAEKSSTTTTTAVQAEQAKPFFSKADGGDFFAPAVQTKLNVGQAGDVYEQEADRMAAMVVGGENSPKSASQPTTDGGANAQRKPLANTVTPFVQRKAEQKEEAVQKAEEEEEEEVQTQTVQRNGKQEEKAVQKAEEEEAVQTQTVQQKGEQEEEVVQKAAEEEAVQARFNGAARRNTLSLESRLRTSTGRGSMLPDSIRAEMEQGFGADFGNVRIHTDSPAVGMNEELHAQAFAHGSDIYFNTGKYNPATTPGKILLAHELTHTIQQGAIRPLEPTEQEQQPTVDAAANELPSSEAPAAIPATDAATDGTAEAADTLADASPEVDPQNPEAATDEATQSGSATPRSPEDDPNFQAVVQNAAAVADHQQRHNPPQAEAASAQAAAPVAGNEVMGAAQANQVEAMNEQEPAAFDAESFKARLMERITSMQLPENQEEAANFDENNNIEEVNQAANQDVSVVQQNAAAPIDAVSQAEPDTGAVAEREVTPLPSPDVGSTPGSISADTAMPSPRPDSEVSQPLQENMAQVDNAMAENEVTDDMLANSNEPSFTGALDQTNQARENTATAPGLLRADEGGTLTSAQQSAEGQSNRQLQNMQADREGTLGMMTGQQNQTATQDSAERQRISSEIDAIYNKAKTDVEQLLENLETQVSEKFTAAANRAKEAFETYVDQKMSAYKSRRYGGLDGPFLWARDKFMGLPGEVNQFFVDGRQLYIDQMDRELTTISQFVAEQLTAAKNRIAEGRQEVADYVAALPESLQSIGREAAEAIQSQFDSLQDDVNSKQDELIDSLAQQYSEALQSVDARIEEMKAANRGLVDIALGAIMAVIEAIINIKNMLMNLLSAAMEVISTIITDPIGFLKNLFGGIALGFEQFGANILKHLQAGFLTWLTGAMSGVNLQMPDDIFSLKGIFSLTSQILGFTWDRVRAIGVKVIGEPVMKALEVGFDIVMILREKGLAGLWEYLKEQFNDLKETVMGAIMDMIQSQVIQAGIKWLLGLLSPVGAFIKACMAIIEVVKFFVQKAAQIIELVNAFIEGVRAVASGSVNAVANAIENALAKAIPVVIGFLAALLGISGLAAKVTKIFQKIQDRVAKAITKLWMKIKEMGKKVLAKLGIGGKTEYSPEKQKKIDAGFTYLKQQEAQLDSDGNNKLTIEQAGQAAQRTKAQHPVFSTLKAEAKGKKLIYVFSASATNQQESTHEVEGDGDKPKLEEGAAFSKKESSRWYSALIKKLFNPENRLKYNFDYKKYKAGEFDMTYIEWGEGIKNNTISKIERSRRDRIVAEAENYEEPIKSLILGTLGGYRDNVIDDLRDLISTAGGAKEFKEMYSKAGKDFLKKIDDLIGKYPVTRNDFKELFKGFEAHHVIPANFLRTNPIIQELLIGLNHMGISFGYNNIDNLIFVPSENHTSGKQRSHPEYDEKIRVRIEEKVADLVKEGKYERALSELKKIIEEVKNKFISEIIGSSQSAKNI